nr:hypothetical protein [Tanacetum cinerariifolium]
MDHQYPTVAKIPTLDTGKFEQWQFQIQQYPQHKHYALWEVIEFDNSYKIPTTTDPNNTTMRKDDEKSGRTITITIEDMQRKKNDVKAGTTLLLSLPNKHHLALEWLMHNIVWRNKNDLDTMSLDDLYNHLKVYEAEVQKKSNPNSQNMAFISSSKHSSGDEHGKFEQWQFRIQQYLQLKHYALWEVIEFGDSYKVPKSIDSAESRTGRTITPTTEDMQKKKNDVQARTTLLLSLPDEKNNDSLNSKIKDLTDELFEANNYIFLYKLAIAQLEGRLVEYKEREVKYIEKIRTLEMYRESNLNCIETLGMELETLKLEKDGVDGKLAGLLKASKNLDNLIESQRFDKVKDGVGYNAIPPPAADLYLSPKKDLTWTGLPEFVDDTVSDYSRPSPTIASTSAEGQNKNSTTSEDVASPNIPNTFVKFVKPKDSQSESKTNKQETPKKPQVKYAEQYRHSNKKPNVKGNQRNSNNLKSYQLGPEFVLKKKACFSCGNYSHLANDCRKRIQRETTRSQNHDYMSPTHRSVGHRPHGAPMRPPHRSAGHRPHGAPMRPPHRSAGHRPHEASMRPPHRSTGHRPYGPSMNLMRSNMIGARPNRSFFIQAHSYETRPFLKTSAVKIQYRAPWVPTVNKNNPPVNRKFSTGNRNFHYANRKFPTVS